MFNRPHAALIENLQRENLNPIEEAEGYQRLIQHFELTHEALGSAVSQIAGACWQYSPPSDISRFRASGNPRWHSDLGTCAAPCWTLP